MHAKMNKEVQKFNLTSKLHEVFRKEKLIPGLHFVVLCAVQFGVEVFQTL